MFGCIRGGLTVCDFKSRPINMISWEMVFSRIPLRRVLHHHSISRSNSYYRCANALPCASLGDLSLSMSTKLNYPKKNADSRSMDRTPDLIPRKSKEETPHPISGDKGLGIFFLERYYMERSIGSSALETDELRGFVCMLRVGALLFWLDSEY